MKLSNLVGQKKTSDHLALKIIGGAVLGLFAAGVLYNFADIKRYIKMTNM